MADDRTTAYAEALFAVARTEGPLTEVEDELFRVAQVVKGNDELRDKLADPHIPHRCMGAGAACHPQHCPEILF